MELRLRPFGPDDAGPAQEAHLALAAEQFPFLLDWRAGETWGAYVDRLREVRHGRNLPPRWVASALLAADVRGELVGRVSIRYELNDFLENFGGRIGYAVIPRYRRRGYATEILRQALIVARAEGVERVLVACDDDNLVSAKVIEHAGGVLEDIRVDPEGVPKRRYWIS